MSEALPPLVVDPDSTLADASPAQLATALAWKSARFGLRQTGRAARRLPGVAGRLRRHLPKGPIARAADRGFSLWSTDSRWSIAAIKSHASAWSVWSMFSAGSVGAIGSIASIGSVGSAGSLLSIGSAGSILSIGAAGSVLSIGGVNRRPWSTPAAADDAAEADTPALAVIERGATVLGVLAVSAAFRSSLLSRRSTRG
jgi:hypothetical protein